MAPDEIHFADGIDTPDRLAFGLGAGQLAVVVVGLLCAYAAARSTLPWGARVPLSLCIALLAATLGWMKVSGRPVLEWAVFAARFVARATEGSLLIMPGSCAGLTHIDHVALRPPPARLHARLDRPGSCVIVPLFAADAIDAHRARRVVFFSLKGGVGRTTLSVELACWLAACGRRRVTSESVDPALRVALIDLDAQSPSVALRLGIPQLDRERALTAGPYGGRDTRVMHRSGAQVVPPPAGGERVLDTTSAHDLLAHLDEDGFDIVVIDVAGELAATTGALLQQADDIFIVMTPTATGVHDAYRTTQLLRRAGLRDRISCVVNRARADVDVSDTIADLCLRVIAEVPDDAVFVEAENSHRQVSLSTAGASAAALRAIGEHVIAHLL